MHHAMVDRMWWTWRNRDLEIRLFAVGATLTMKTSLPSRNVTPGDEIRLGYMELSDLMIREASDVLGGPLCCVCE